MKSNKYLMKFKEWLNEGHVPLSINEENVKKRLKNLVDKIRKLNSQNYELNVNLNVINDILKRDFDIDALLDALWGVKAQFFNAIRIEDKHPEIILEIDQLFKDIVLLRHKIGTEHEIIFLSDPSNYYGNPFYMFHALESEMYRGIVRITPQNFKKIEDYIRIGRKGVATYKNSELANFYKNVAKHINDLGRKVFLVKALLKLRNVAEQKHDLSMYNAVAENPFDSSTWLVACDWIDENSKESTNDIREFVNLYLIKRKPKEVKGIVSWK